MQLKKLMQKTIPTTVITGFLGAGKTTAIQSLLERKPTHERWAVLVNEFGEIGVDARLLASPSVSIKEVAGGCMCCVSGVPMRVALTQLLKEARPDRLIIEPTGLGHTQDVLAQLHADFSAYLTLNATITLVDPARLIEPRYREHPIFAGQIAAADVLLASKSDIASDEHKVYFDNFAHALPELHLADHLSGGDIPLSYLDLPAQKFREAPRFALSVRGAQDESTSSELVLQPYQYIQKLNKTRSFLSIGWAFSATIEWDANAVFEWLLSIYPERGKAVVITTNGVISFNGAEGKFTAAPLDVKNLDMSRIEIILSASDSSAVDDLGQTLETELLKCVVNLTGLQKIV